jgi:hypothetical protein
VTKPRAWRQLNDALVDMRQADQRGEADVARKKLGEALAALEALGELMRA